MKYGLINTAAPGRVIRRQDFGTDTPPVQDDGTKWVKDTPPVFDDTKQTRANVAEIPVNATEVPYVVTDIPLERLRDVRRELVEKARYAVEAEGIVVDGIPIDTDRQSRATMMEVFKAMQDGFIISSINLKTSNGFTPDLDIAAMTSIVSATMAHVQEAFNKEARLFADIDVAATAEAINAVGWP
jgi:hypothetical protein